MYTIKILKSEEYDKLPYKHAKTSLGCADPKTGKAYVRATGVKEWDMATLSHEVDELVAKVSPHEEDGIRYKGEAKLETKVVEDPYKTKVSGPLSEFLSRQVGKGLPSYQSTGQSLYEPLDPKAVSSYQNFLSMSPNEWYQKGVEAPTLRAMREQIPLIEESWAGGLRGSGRFRDVEDYIGDTMETIAEGRYKAELEIPQAQFGMAQSYSQMRTQQRMLEYADWLQSLPEMNPNLDRALQFLAGDSGYNILAYQTGGKSGAGGMIGSGLGMIAGAIIGNMIAPGIGALVGAGLGGSAGGSIGGAFG